MGVLGLTPFLLKVCPDVFKTLPDRLNSLRGKKVVMYVVVGSVSAWSTLTMIPSDGTLLTQRLHFAPMPHKYRHVLGWYRMVKELHESGVQALCVFDGRERSLAKQIEVERRRKVRRMTEARGVLESERFRRLQRLERLSEQWSTLDEGAREEALAVIHALLSDWKPPSLDQLLHNHQSIDVLSVASGKQLDTTSENFESSGLSRHPGSMSSPRNGNTLADRHIIKGSSIQRNSYDSLAQHQQELDLQELTDDLAIDDIGYNQINTKELFTTSLMAQYIQYQQSIPKLESLTNPLLAPSRAEVDSRDDYVMSKNQQQLTLDEGRFWEHLAGCSTSEEASTVMHTDITSLARKSYLISQSYERRTNPPTVETYEESKEILRAMGIPCIETGGPFEAEALASSLVLNGYADYVASEDSDVIVFEAPLIRNLTSRREPLVLISGAEVRSGLQLDRASFIDFALLLGTDFSQRIKNVGPQRALKFIREHGSIERVLEKERQYPPRVSEAEYLTQVARARQVFDILPPAPDLSTMEPPAQDDNVVNMILRRYNLQREISDDWEYHEALAGNYFQDNPAAS
ncbi:PIN domain-like protein [Cristinia sonorae]|uniref:PIN domain-like protein n=1 Tax=Cristinia sonorae TaxID=1940300 RepID=A0A8K0XQ78_9AGAR|nr:PIN domain-like protein [Cristinia sonorae]